LKELEELDGINDLDTNVEVLIGTDEWIR